MQAVIGGITAQEVIKVREGEEKQDPQKVLRTFHCRINSSIYCVV